MRLCTHVTLGLSLFLVSCAGLTTKKDTAEPSAPPGFWDSSKPRGFRYYLPAWYLLVHTDNNGGLTVTPILLPDTTKRMSTRPYAFLATNDVDLKFSNKGMLTSAKSDADATAVPKAVITAASAVAVGALKAGLLDVERREKPEPGTHRLVPSPYLFKLVQAPDGTYRLRGNEGINLTVRVPRPQKPQDDSNKAND